MLKLAAEEVDDAFAVLSTAPSVALHPAQQAQLSTALSLLGQAQAATDPAVRRDRTNDARSLLQTVKSALGTGMNFQLGTGNIMF